VRTTPDVRVWPPKLPIFVSTAGKVRRRPVVPLAVSVALALLAAAFAAAGTSPAVWAPLAAAAAVGVALRR
jgi:hypothetical protein